MDLRLAKEIIGRGGAGGVILMPDQARGYSKYNSFYDLFGYDKILKLANF